MSAAQKEILFGAEYENLYVDAGTITSSGHLDAIWQVLQGKKWVDIPTQEIENHWEEFESEDGYPNRILQSTYPIKTDKYPSGGKFRCIIWDTENPKDKIISKTINLKVLKKHISVPSTHNYKNFTAIKGIDQVLEVYGKAVGQGAVHCAWKKITNKRNKHMN